MGSKTKYKQLCTLPDAEERTERKMIEKWNDKESCKNNSMKKTGFNY
jgi:hypothetical protein